MKLLSRPLAQSLVLCAGLIILSSALAPTTLSEHNNREPYRSSLSTRDSKGQSPVNDSSRNTALSLAAGDFDEDGVPDLLSGHSAPWDGAVVLHSGNVDALYPNSPQARERKGNGKFPVAPFLPVHFIIPLSSAPDFLVAGDFDADDHLDIVAATRGGAQLYLLRGNGAGDFEKAEVIKLPGKVTSMIAGEISRVDGLADLAVGVEAEDGSRLLIFRSPNGALRSQPQSLSLSGHVGALSLGDIDGDQIMDVLAATGSQIAILNGIDRDQTFSKSFVTLPSAIVSLVAARWDGEVNRSPIALCEDGKIYKVRQAFTGGRPKLLEPAKSSAPENWVSEVVADMSDSASQTLTSQLLPGVGNDLLLVGGSSRISVINPTPRSSQLSFALSFANEAQSTLSLLRGSRLELPGEAVAVLPMRLNSLAFSSLVVLLKDDLVPHVLLPQAASTFTVLNTNDNGTGSLRQAILDANANAGVDTIAFNIPGGGPYSIALQSQLPAISEAVTIDATTQPGFVGSPIIELNGTNAGAASGLIVNVSNVVIRGFVINRFSDYCVKFLSGDPNNFQSNNVLEGNFIGIDTTGHTALGSLGVFVKASAAQIGGTTTAARNVISPNIRILADSTCCFGGMQTNAVIQGNFIGTDLTGQTAVGGGGIAVSDPSSQGVAQATIGGTQPGARNVILGGINISPRTNGALIQGNYIGTEVTGFARLGNGNTVNFNGILGMTLGGPTAAARNVIADGVTISSSVGCPPNFPQSPFALVQRNFIGVNVNGTTSLGNTGNGVTIQGVAGAVIGDGNLITFNGGDGISVNAACSNLIQSNAIFSNGGLGIRVQGGPPTPAPVLTSATYAAGTLRINGTVSNTANSNLTLQFFSNNECDPSGFGEGQTPLGSQAVTTDGSGVANFEVVLSVPVAPGSFITATSTGPTSNTSSFSRCRMINAADISGRVTLSGNGLSGVTMTLSGAQSASTTTNANGDYLFENLPRVSSYVVTPSKANYVFTPTSQSVEGLNSNQILNFTAGAATYTISGQVLKAGSGFAGVTMNLTGSQTGTVLTDGSGHYSFTVNSGGSYTVTASRANYSFAPPSASFNNVQANQVANFDATLLNYTISGHITLNSNGLSGVAVALSGGQSASTVTDGMGNYSFSNVAGEVNYIVTPSLAPYSFNPSSRSFTNLSGNQTAADFVAIPPTFTISGLITDSNSAPISNVIVSLTGTTSSTAVTAPNGSYSFSNLTLGGNYVVTPARTNYSFGPTLRTFVNLTSDQTANFTGTLLSYTISGRIIKSPNTGVVGITVQSSGSQTATTTTDSDGNYSFTAPGDGNYTVTPSSTSYSFSPASLTFNDLSQNQTAANFTATALPTTMFFAASNYNVSENSFFVTITVNRTGDTTGASSVDFSSSNGSASQTQDYQIANGTLNFAAGDTARTFRVLIIDDVYVESSETINLTLTNPVGASLAAPSAANVTIADNDSAGVSSPVARQFVANLTPNQVVPPVISSAIGGGVVQLNQTETAAKVSLIFSSLSGTEFLAGIRGPAAPGVNAPIVFHLPLGNPVVDFLISPTSQEVADLKAGLHFMDVHTSGFGNGEIRGQLLWNPVEEADFFVRQNYFDFLSRVPDAGGFTFWQNEITQCQSDVECLRRKRVDVSNAFFYEQEFQQTAAYVLRLYRGAYGNNQPFPNPNANPGFPNEEKKLPSYAVFVADRARVIGGANLAQRQLDLANLFVTRPEFIAKYPASLSTADQFVDALLLTLQNDLDVNLTGQRTNLINIYNTQGGRGGVLYRLADDNATNPIANQPFIDEEYNRALVLGQYFGYLRRNPDIPGFQFWLGQVNGAPLRDVPKQHAMVCSFITSSEYQFRFGPVASRNNNECPQ